MSKSMSGILDQSLTLLGDIGRVRVDLGVPVVNPVIIGIPLVLGIPFTLFEILQIGVKLRLAVFLTTNEQSSTPPDK